MSDEEYKRLVKKHIPYTNKSRNMLIAFVVGGIMGIISQGLNDIIRIFFDVDKTVSSLAACLIIVFISSLLTALGFFDNWVKKAKCGLIIPTTGFAHSVTSSAMDYRKEGLINGIGSNTFKLAGSVIIYGILSAFLLCVLRVIIWL